MSPEVIAPIFIVGCYRSGTSIFHTKVALHPDFAFITRATKSMPASLLHAKLLCAVRRAPVYRRPTGGHRWTRFAHADHDVLRAEDVTPRADRYFRNVVQTHLVLQGRSRFLSKSSNNSFQMHYLRRIFPDAFFIHLVRDGRAVVESIMRCRSRKGPRNYGSARFPGWRETLDMPLHESSAIQWKETVECVEDQAGDLPADAFIRVRYEDFVDNPREIAAQIGDAAGLSWTSDVLDQFCAGLRSRNDKWRDVFDADQKARLNELLGDTLRKFGYEV